MNQYIGTLIRVVLSTATICGVSNCMSTQPSAEPFGQWRLTDTPYPNGDNVWLDAEFYYDVSLDQVQIDKRKQCAIQRNDFRLTTYTSGTPATTTIELKDVLLQIAHEPRTDDNIDPTTCHIEVRAVVNIKGTGPIGIYLTFGNISTNGAIITVLKPTQLGLNFSGHEQFNILSGQAAYFEPTLVDREHTPLNPVYTSHLSTDISSIANLLNPGFRGLWWIKADNPGTVPFKITMDNGMAFDSLARVLSADAVQQIRFYTLDIFPKKDVTDLRSTPTFKWTPITTNELTIPMRKKIALIASTVDAAGVPLYSGFGSITYVVEQFPIVSAIPQSIGSMLTTRDGVTYQAGPQWLELNGLQPGGSTISATWSDKAASLKIRVIDED